MYFWRTPPHLTDAGISDYRLSVVRIGHEDLDFLPRHLVHAGSVLGQTSYPCSQGSFNRDNAEPSTQRMITPLDVRLWQLEPSESENIATRAEPLHLGKA